MLKYLNGAMCATASHNNLSGMDIFRIDDCRAENYSRKPCHKVRWKVQYGNSEKVKVSIHIPIRSKKRSYPAATHSIIVFEKESLGSLNCTYLVY